MSDDASGNLSVREDVASTRGQCSVIGVGTLGDMEDTGRSAPRLGWLAAFWLTMAGGVVGLVAEFADLPGWLGLAGAAAFIVGTVKYWV